MTPKEKATEITNKFLVKFNGYFTFEDAWKLAKEDSLICVKEIIKSGCTKPSNGNDIYDDEIIALRYWFDVKQEIKKI